MVINISIVFEVLKNEGIEPGMIVVSTAGHDKNKVYLVLECKEKIAYVVNGLNRGFDYPKKKRVRHLRVICEACRDDIVFTKIAMAKNILEKNTVIRKIIDDSINKSNQKKEDPDV